MVAELAAAVVFLAACGAELLHMRRRRRVAALAFGPSERPASWTIAAPLLSVLAITAVCWGLTTLMILKPKVHKAEEIEESEMQHLMMVLDVSPSMRLKDAGPEKKLSRMQRAAEVMESFFERVNMHRYRVSVVAFYNDAKPVVEDTKDLEVIRNILGDLPMHFAFPVGETDLFSGIKAAGTMAKDWNPRSTTLVLISDGDTVPATGMPKLPVSIANSVVIGVGDSRQGTFISGRHSRQDVSTLRQVAIRLGGVYHNGNEKHLSTALLNQLATTATESPLEQLTRREYALLACGLGGLIYAVLPWLLHVAGTRWKPGVQPVPVQNNGKKPAVRREAAAVP